ncbi:Hypothetical small peptide [Latilactobacillus sakei subsp. sakei 23K]|uniref:Hypothetical small peptide n=1 Tax=Latilactobacillus sakei subsp. sakei (strain 23K) TaxID=314315 RepID=Q38W59_LATSS|nr:Hypothetical small peptide [Latilactobacillus sakei subsp. sakei 23K]
MTVSHRLTFGVNRKEAHV